MEYDAGQLSAGFRAMTMLAGLVRRGGRPAAVAPTVALRPGEKQYGWFPVTLKNERRIAVITSRRLIVGDEYLLSGISAMRLSEWSVALRFQDRTVELSGPWVPWMSVVICAEIYGTALPPAAVPAPRREINTRTPRKKLMAPMDCRARGLRR
ncbi:hypothetical protein ACQPZX_01065 [Actinoplanes sp. CA-142083]|uniref:hypothetical protein n=1 Tax=Actinoplanes sp. CA-142083 TaxID=3239903 RepID=UPI003D9432D6